MNIFNNNEPIVTVYTMGRNEEHRDKYKLKYTVFNINKVEQDKAGTDTQEHRE